MWANQRYQTSGRRNTQLRSQQHWWLGLLHMFDVYCKRLLHFHRLQNAVLVKHFAQHQLEIQIGLNTKASQVPTASAKRVFLPANGVRWPRFGHVIAAERKLLTSHWVLSSVAGHGTR